MKMVLQLCVAFRFFQKRIFRSYDKRLGEVPLVKKGYETFTRFTLGLAHPLPLL